MTIDRFLSIVLRSIQKRNAIPAGARHPGLTPNPRLTSALLSSILMSRDTTKQQKNNEQRQIGIVDRRKWGSRLPRVVESSAGGRVLCRKEHHGLGNVRQRLRCARSTAAQRAASGKRNR